MEKHKSPDPATYRVSPNIPNSPPLTTPSQPNRQQEPMDTLLNELNSAQRAAVTSPSPILQVLAPPGSGKTKTLTARVAYLLSHHGYRPQDVICCTFTIKASREMRERLAKLVGDEVQSRLILGTFHSICRRYLVTYGYLIGLRRGFGIADSGDSLAIIKRIIKRLNLNIQPNTARSRISHQKAHGISPEQAAAKQERSTKVVVEQREFVQVYTEYEAQLAAAHLLDYDDLLVRCAELLRHHPECVSNVQTVLVDEFQDTNHIQYELMNLFAAAQRRITVVGDPDQSIYGFRSAEIKNLTRMQQRYRDTAAVVLLEDNYRSSGSILRGAQDVIEQDTARPAKSLQATHCGGTMPVLRRLPTAEAEAQWIVLEIKRCVAMTGKLVKYSDFAILLRSAALSRQIEAEMGRQGMPYRMVGGLRFFDRVEIKLLLDYLRVVSQPGNTDALLRVINVPSRKIGEETIRVLVSGAEKAKKPLWEFAKDVAQGRQSTEKNLSKPANNGLCTFVGLIESARQKLSECEDASAPRKLLEYVIKKLSFRDYLTMTYGINEENRWANVEELLGQADDTTATDDTEQDESLPEIEGISQEQAHAGEEALSRFLANVALSTEIKPQEGDEGEDANEKVTISTIHAAKGLEWPVVFVPAVYNGIIPHSRAEDSDEERRLLYVAMTRAQALLYLSYPLKQSRSGEATSMSPFLPEKITETRFRFVGPSLVEKTVYSIADILRRPRPSVDAMSEGQVSLISTLDDQWTPEGQEAPDAVRRWDGSRATGDEPNSKRRRYEHDQSTPTMMTTMSAAPYTMSSGTNFSIPTTMSSLGGFSTAREYITSSAAAAATTSQEQKPNKAGLAAASQSQPRAPNAGGRGSDGLAQKSIAGFFTNSRSSTANASRESAPQMSDRHQPSGNRRGDPSRPAPPRDAPNVAVVLPANFSTHRPQAPRPARPILEPSDPNRYTWLGGGSGVTSKPTGRFTVGGSRSNGSRSNGSGQENGELCDDNEGKARGEGEAGTSEVKRSGGRGRTITTTTTTTTTTTLTVGGVRLRPATTYHTTTMQTVQGGAGGSAPRRTLGIRRSMNGWEDRMKRGS